LFKEGWRAKRDGVVREAKTRGQILLCASKFSLRTIVDYAQDKI